jgi:hypothetical protein
MGTIAGDSIGEGWDAAPNSDEFALTETFLTGGTLLAAGESLSLGNAFAVGSVGDLIFNFTEVGGDALVTGLVNYVTGLAGDYNGDGVVDAADYTVWRDTTGSTGPGLAADGNGDMTVDAADYAIWRANFGTSQAASSSLAAAAVPEPTAAWLLLVSIALAWRGCRR